jgi:hypothetical protein
MDPASAEALTQALLAFDAVLSGAGPLPARNAQRAAWRFWRDLS